jgi:hypothetical protein
MESKVNLALKAAYERGYRIIEGRIFYKEKEIKRYLGNSGYYVFTIRLNNSRPPLGVHKLVAYQKYKDEMFAEGIEVRHLDGNRLNNLEDNILLGTHKKNMEDKPREVTQRAAAIATSYIKKYNHEEAIKLRKEGKSYKEIMLILNIKNKGTLSFIINKSELAKN